nr:hypothetical protein BaRGS_014756 [Batillaria attramentaria]
MNSTTSGSSEGGFGLCLAAWLLSGVTLGGNVLTIAAIVQVQRLRTLSNHYIASLACADCLVGLMMPVLGLSFLPAFSNWFHQNYAACMTLLSLIYMSAFSSGFHLLLVTVDRYIYIVHPFHYPRVVTEKTVAVKISVAWVASVVYGCGTFVANDFARVGRCDSWQVLHPVYNVYTSGGMFFLTSSVIGSLYMRITIVAIRKRKPPPSAVVSRDLNSVPVTATTAGAHPVSPLEARASGCSLKTTAPATGTTQSCDSKIGPSSFQSSCREFSGEDGWALETRSERDNTDPHVLRIESVESIDNCDGAEEGYRAPHSNKDEESANNCVNFFVYALMNKDFRAYFRRRLCCAFGRVRNMDSSYP